MSRVAAIDGGTHSMRLLIADVEEQSGQGGSATVVAYPLVRRTRTVRLGAGVDATGRIGARAVDAAQSVMREFAELCRHFEVDEVRFVATSAARDAQNSDVLLAAVTSTFAGFAVTAQVISGAEEARLSYLGATRSIWGQGGSAGCLVVDVGGGSTECVVGTAHRHAAMSVNVGCLRWCERWGDADPPSPEQLRAAARIVDAELDQLDEGLGWEGVRTLVGVAGSVAAVTAFAMGLTAQEVARVHLAELPVATVMAACAEITASSRADLAARCGGDPGDLDVVVAGALIWGRIVQRVSERTGVGFAVTSLHDVVDGIAVDRVGSWPWRAGGDGQSS
ncbi:Ppx/GppA phosphatase family protein [Austwickia sp. TVS 96-490-7B]|uniref:Ppx/GppA phosphatase family protein n=1 Tax=Austwickia sp. TVS 96-490-7B TaxID=2830843 RepID=UPI001C56F0FD|nr:exopolyphosphatase [Austwickia sp. TVS 96-490-7B]